jgi:RNA polymerase sigma factor (TIGR02999 family)
MRQILVDQVRRKSARKHGGGQERLDADEVDLPIEVPTEDLLALDQALTRLERDDERKARIVCLRYFAGLDREEVAEVLGISLRTVDREWKAVVARLHRDLAGPPSRGGS